MKVSYAPFRRFMTEKVHDAWRPYVLNIGPIVRQVILRSISFNFALFRPQNGG